jgi:hypothetical protein
MGAVSVEAAVDFVVEVDSAAAVDFVAAVDSAAAVAGSRIQACDLQKLSRGGIPGTLARK